MGFFDGIKKEYKIVKAEREERERNKEYVPQNNKYQPGHKNMTGPAKHNALINLLGTSDLDEVFEGCAPHFTEALYGIRDKLDEDENYRSKYREMKVRYEELEKHYLDLQEQYKSAMEIMKNLSAQQNNAR